MSALDSVSPTDAELILEVFKALKPNQSTSAIDFMKSESERCGREWGKTHDQTKVERAFHRLFLLGYTREVSSGYYNLFDQKITANVVMRTLLKNSYDETKEGLNDFHRRDQYFRPLMVLAIVFFSGRISPLPGRFSLFLQPHIYNLSWSARLFCSLSQCCSGSQVFGS